MVAGVAIFVVCLLVYARPAKRPPPLPLTAAEAEFDRQGVILQEYCRQGVSFDVFSRQLVLVHAAGRTAEKEIQRRDWVKKAAYDQAAEMWDAALILWRKDIGGLKVIGGPRLAEFMAKLDRPGLSAKLRAEEQDERAALRQFGRVETEEGIATARLVRAALGEGVRLFQEAMEFNFDEKIAKMKAGRKGK